MKGYYFHLEQSIWHYIQDEDFVDLYMDNQSLQLQMKMLAALAFGPPNLVIQYFEIFQKGNPSKLDLLWLFRRQVSSVLIEITVTTCSNAFNRNVVYVWSIQDWSNTHKYQQRGLTQSVLTYRRLCMLN